MIKEKKVIQCCYCKNNDETMPGDEFFNIDGLIAHGCTRCKSYYELYVENHD